MINIVIFFMCSQLPATNVPKADKILVEWVEQKLTGSCFCRRSKSMFIDLSLIACVSIKSIIRFLETKTEFNSCKGEI